MLGCKDSTTFIVENTGVMPIKWKLGGIGKLETEYKELSIFPAAGDLAARSSQRVTVEFTALAKRAIEVDMRVEVTDASGSAKLTPFPIKVLAEAYNIEVKPRWPNLKYPGIDFGTVRVQEPKTVSLVIPNSGKYPVDFKFNLKTAAIRRLFTFVPDSGTIAPGSQANIEVTFNKDAGVVEEVTLQHNTDVSLTIIEPLTGERCISACCCWC